MTTPPAYWLGPLLLENGFERDAAGQVVSTSARRAHLLIADGRIAEMRFDSPPDDGRPRRDACGWLALPAFADMHIHLDKGHYGGPWRAATPFISVAERIREEQGFLLDFLPDTRRRAEALLDLIAASGVAFARVHCNVDPVAGLATMEQVRLALDSRRHWLDYELVAFPQHGLLAGDTIKLMDQALASGFDVVGGVDPASVDGDIERSLNATLELAVKHGAPVDLHHLHDRGELGAYTLERLARLSESAGLAGRVSVSHAYCLGELEPSRLDQVCARAGRQRHRHRIGCAHRCAHAAAASPGRARHSAEPGQRQHQRPLDAVQQRQHRRARQPLGRTPRMERRIRAEPRVAPYHPRTVAAGRRRPPRMAAGRRRRQPDAGGRLLLRRADRPPQTGARGAARRSAGLVGRGLGPA
ncbi:hypothetical protein JOS77_25945 [Chromobacterium haemolyticum]|nr:hypothetical protein JOS77_25945 [Chromobacterium haemolyticum]